MLFGRGRFFVPVQDPARWQPNDNGVLRAGRHSRCAQSAHRADGSYVGHGGPEQGWVHSARRHEATHPPASAYCRCVLARDAHRCCHRREWIVNLGSREAYSRIAHLFCEIFFKLKAVGLTHGHSFDFPVTQAKIADATGLSDVHVNRSLMKLRADGLIAIERGRCTIPDMGRLEEAAMFDTTYLHLKELAPSPARVAAQ